MVGSIIAMFLAVTKLCIRKVPISTIGTRSAKIYMNIMPLIINLMILSSILINVFLFFMIVVIILIFAIFLFYKNKI
jgi:hypothetical protein